MTAVSAEEGSLSSKRSWNLKAESSFIYLNAGSAESAFGPTKARSSAALVPLQVRFAVVHEDPVPLPGGRKLLAECCGRFSIQKPGAERRRQAMKISNINT
jgi:hypothetical protein